MKLMTSVHFLNTAKNYALRCAVDKPIWIVYLQRTK